MRFGAETTTIMQKSSQEDWVKIAQNLNQIRACLRSLQDHVHKMNRPKGFNSVHKRLETARRNLRDRYQKEHPQDGDLIVIDNKSGLELILEDGKISPKSEVVDDLGDYIGDFKVLSTVPEKYGDVAHASVKLDPDNPDDWPDNSMEEWREAAEIVEVMEDSYSYLFCGDHNLPKSAFNDFTLDNAMSRIRSDLEEQMFDEHPDQASTSVFYGS